MNLPKLPKLPIQPKMAAIIFGVLLVAIGLFFGFRAISSRASGQDPQNVVVANINENSATVSWTSGTAVQCTLEYGTSATSLTFFAPETGQPTTNHAAKLSLLSPNTTYFFQIKCADKSYNNGGVPWSFSTRSAGTQGGSQVTSTPSSTLVPTESLGGATPPPAGSPTPFQKLSAPTSSQRVSSPAPTSTASINGCTETSCAAIKTKLGNGCSTQDYFKCIYKLTGTPSPTP